MDSRSSALLFFISLYLSFASLLIKCHSSSSNELKTYIVYTGNIKTDEASALSQYTSFCKKQPTAMLRPRQFSITTDGASMALL
ncbi:hypothetical protein K1719_039675 [Acacia pycnantha]|nr:hypothetical protein K1719_039675 [Acacia pycnantha]